MLTKNVLNQRRQKHKLNSINILALRHLGKARFSDFQKNQHGQNFKGKVVPQGRHCGSKINKLSYTHANIIY